MRKYKSFSGLKRNTTKSLKIGVLITIILGSLGMINILSHQEITYRKHSVSTIDDNANIVYSTPFNKSENNFNFETDGIFMNCMRIPEDRRNMDEYYNLGGDAAFQMNLNYLNSSSVVFDIGGNKGGFAKFASHTRLFIFEPVLEFYNFLLEIFPSNVFPDITVVNYGIGKKDASSSILIDGIEGSASSQFTSDLQNQNRVLTKIVIKTMATAMDELKLTHVDLLNINCEGCEFDVMESIIDQGILSRIQRIQVQYHPGLVTNGTVRRCKIHSILSKKSFFLEYNIDWIWERWSRERKINLKKEFMIPKINTLIDFDLEEVRISKDIWFLFPKSKEATSIDKSFFEKGVESQIKYILIKIFNVHKNQTFMDIGMNNGYFTLMAAAFGQHVLSFDPQLLCHELVQKAAVSSGFSKLITQIPTALHYIEHLPVNIDSQHCNSGYETSISPTNIEKSIIFTTVADNHLLTQLTTDKVNIKIDTEGFEINVLKGLLKTLRGEQRGNIFNIIVEIAPHTWEKNNIPVSEGIHVLKQITSFFKNSVILYDDLNPFSNQAVVSKKTMLGLYVLCPLSWSDVIDQKMGKGAMNVWFSKDEELYFDWKCSS